MTRQGMARSPPVRAHSPRGQSICSTLYSYVFRSFSPGTGSGAATAVAFRRSTTEGQLGPDLVPGSTTTTTKEAVKFKNDAPAISTDSYSAAHRAGQRYSLVARRKGPWYVVSSNTGLGTFFMEPRSVRRGVQHAGTQASPSEHCFPLLARTNLSSFDGYSGMDNVLPRESTLDIARVTTAISVVLLSSSDCLSKHQCTSTDP
jgi:hypothetical protein